MAAICYMQTEKREKGAKNEPLETSAADDWRDIDCIIHGWVWCYGSAAYASPTCSYNCPINARACSHLNARAYRHPHSDTNSHQHTNVNAYSYPATDDWFG
jgi:hypothetical protein